MLQERIERLCARRRFGMKPGLHRVEALLHRLGEPQRELAAIHVAGTNGKGSVTAMIAEVLSAAGYAVGRFTSPHLLRFNERICIGGRPIDDPSLEAVLGDVEEAARALEAEGMEAATFFECATAAGFEVFRRRGVCLAVVEVGLGGRLDATNVLTPLVSVITRIGLEHCAYLGDSLGAIAAEKAGIVKAGRPVVIGAMPEEAREVVCATAARLGSPRVDATESVTVSARRCGLDGQRIDLATEQREVTGIHLRLSGSFQLENVATAAAALECVSRVGGLPLADEAFTQGFERVQWPARFQVVRREPPVIVDGAHNPDAASALRAALRRLRFKGPVGLVAGFCDDKDVAGCLKALQGGVRRAWAVAVPSPRSLSAMDTLMQMRAAGLEATLARDLPAALAEGEGWARANGGLLLVCGSLFLAGEALRLYGALPWADPGNRADANESLVPGADR